MQGAALKHIGTSLSSATKLLPSNCYPSGWHSCPNPNCNARFSSKKRLLRALPFLLLRTVSMLRIFPFPRICNLSVNRTRVRCLEGECVNQRWSPRGQILKSLASRPQVLKNWPVLGSRTAVFFEWLKFFGAPEKFFGKRMFVEIA